MGKQGVILKNHTDLPLLRRQVIPRLRKNDAADADHPVNQRLETGNATEQGGVATARWPQQTGNLPCFNAEAGAVNHGMRAVTLDDVF